MDQFFLLCHFSSLAVLFLSSLLLLFRTQLQNKRFLLTPYLLAFFRSGFLTLSFPTATERNRWLKLAYFFELLFFKSLMIATIYYLKKHKWIQYWITLGYFSFSYGYLWFYYSQESTFLVYDNLLVIVLFLLTSSKNSYKTLACFAILSSQLLHEYKEMHGMKTMVYSFFMNFSIIMATLLMTYSFYTKNLRNKPPFYSIPLADIFSPEELPEEEPPEDA